MVLAINKQNFNIAEADKQTPQCLHVFDASIMLHFGAGLKDKIGKVVLRAATPPGTVEEMLQAAEAVEAELAKIGQPGTSALAVQEEAVTDPEVDQMSDFAKAIEEICAIIGLKHRRLFDKPHSKCYNCYKFGHFQNKCPEPRLTPFQGQGASPTTGPPNTRRPNPTKRQWAQNVVDEYKDTPITKEEDHDQDNQEPQDLGNYHGRPE